MGASIKSENQYSTLTESKAGKYSFYQELVNLILMNPVCFSQEQHFSSLIYFSHQNIKHSFLNGHFYELY